MPQIQESQSSQTVQLCATCETCPMFINYEGTRNRGTCTLFDKVTLSHHKQTQDCRNHLQEVTVHLYSEAQEQDPDDGHWEPQAQISLSLFLSEITEEVVHKVFTVHQQEFYGFYVAYFHPSYPDAEF